MSISNMKASSSASVSVRACDTSWLASQRSDRWRRSHAACGSATSRPVGASQEAEPHVAGKTDAEAAVAADALSSRGLVAIAAGNPGHGAAARARTDLSDSWSLFAVLLLSAMGNGHAEKPSPNSSLVAS
jgi:hypothetical protein